MVPLSSRGSIAPYTFPLRHIYNCPLPYQDLNSTVSIWSGGGFAPYTFPCGHIYSCSLPYQDLWACSLPKTGNLLLGLLINYPLEAKIQKSDKVTVCALVPNVFMPNFSLITPNLGQVYHGTSEFARAPLLQRMPSICRSSLHALTSLSQLRCDKKSLL